MPQHFNPWSRLQLALSLEIAKYSLQALRKPYDISKLQIGREITYVIMEYAEIRLRYSTYGKMDIAVSLRRLLGLSTTNNSGTLACVYILIWACHRPRQARQGPMARVGAIRSAWG